MSTRSLVNLLSLAMSGLIVGLVVWRQQDLTHLKSRVTLSQNQHAPTPSRPAPPILPVNSLSEAEKLELSRLRAQVTRLRQRQRELANDKAENNRLRALAQERQNKGFNSPAALAPGYIRRREAQFTGTGSPESTLQSLFWAIEHQDTNVLFQVLDETSATQMRQQLSAQGIDEFWKDGRNLPGYRLLESQPQPDNTVKLKIEWLPDDPSRDATSVTATKTATGWRLKL